MKNKKVLYIIIGIVLGIALSFVTMFTLNKIYAFRENKKAPTKEEQSPSKGQSGIRETLDVESEEVKSLIGSISIADIDTELSGYFYTKDKITTADVANQIKLIIGLQRIYYPAQEITEVTTEQLDKAIKEVFGKDVKYTNEPIHGSCYGSAATYNAADGVYTLTGGCGGTYIPFYSTMLTRAEKIDNTIRISKQVVYVSYDNEIGGMPSPVIYKTDKKTEIAKLAEGEKIENYLKEGDIFTYTFTKDESSSKYYFTSVEKEK